MFQCFLGVEFVVSCSFYIQLPNPTAPLCQLFGLLITSKVRGLQGNIKVLSGKNWEVGGTHNHSISRYSQVQTTLNQRLVAWYPWGLNTSFASFPNDSNSCGATQPMFFPPGLKIQQGTWCPNFCCLPFFGGGELVFVTFFLDMAGLLYHSPGRILEKWPVTELTFIVTPRPQCPPLAMPGRPEHPSVGGGRLPK